MLQPFVAQPCEIPHNAVVTAEQPESALGHNQATELDNEVLEVVDQDQREEEEEALLGRHVNPQGIPYECLCWSPDDSGPDSVSARLVGWPPPLIPRVLSKADLVCVKDTLFAKLHGGIDRLYTQFQNELNAPGVDEECARRIQTLDPTQLIVYSTNSEWAELRLA